MDRDAGEVADGSADDETVAAAAAAAAAADVDDDDGDFATRLANDCVLLERWSSAANLGRVSDEVAIRVPVDVDGLVVPPVDADVPARRAAYAKWPLRDAGVEADDVDEEAVGRCAEGRGGGPARSPPPPPPPTPPPPLPPRSRSRCSRSRSPRSNCLVRSLTLRLEPLIPSADGFVGPPLLLMGDDTDRDTDGAEAAAAARSLGRNGVLPSLVLGSAAEPMAVARVVLAPARRPPAGGLDPPPGVVSD
jgi:hypothetical protein